MAATSPRQGDRDQSAADLVLLDKLHARRLQRRIARFDGGHDACVSIKPIASFAIAFSMVRIQFALSTATVCSATISSSLVGITQMSASDSTALIFSSRPRT